MGCLGCLFILLIGVIFYYLVTISWMSAFSFSILVLAVMVIFRFKMKRDQRNKIQFNLQRVESLKTQLKDFTILKEYVSPQIESSLFFDGKNKKIAIVTEDLSKRRIYSMQDIIASVVKEDGKIVAKATNSKKSKTTLADHLNNDQSILSQVEQERNEKKNKVTRLELMLVVEDKENPVHVISFLSTERLDFQGRSLPVKRTSETYLQAKNECKEWHKLIAKSID